MVEYENKVFSMFTQPIVCLLNIRQCTQTNSTVGYNCNTHGWMQNRSVVSRGSEEENILQKSLEMHCCGL